MSELVFSTQRLDHLGIVAGLCQEIDLMGRIDAFVGTTQRKVSVGQAVQAMVLNALGFVGRALYLSPEFFANKPVDVLIDPGLQAEDLNDDSLGRALDRLYEAGVTEVFAQVAAHALQRFGIRPGFVHLDSTSFSLHGEYVQEGTEPQCIQVTHGHSKDQQPDLKQAVVSLMTSYRSAIPVWLEVLSGNHNDKRGFVRTIETYCAQLTEGPAPYFVADSALYSAENLKTLSQIRWVTRVPETLKAAKELLEQESSQPLKPVEEGYAYLEHHSRYGGVEQRWLLIHSEKAQKREQTSLQKRVARQAQQAAKQLRKLSRRRFACEADAQQAVAKLEQTWRYHRAQITLHTLQRYPRPGRPQAGQSPQVVGYQVKGQVVEDPQEVAKAQCRLGKFILATNELDGKTLPADQLLSVYKAQGVSVERGFRFLKDPLFFAESLFLKRPQRLMALLMVMGLALLVYALAERKVRQALKRTRQTVSNQLGKPTQTPTMRRLFQVFEGIDLLISQHNDFKQRQVLNLQPFHRQILNLLGLNVQKCYLFNS